MRNLLWPGQAGALATCLLFLTLAIGFASEAATNQPRSQEKTVGSKFLFDGKTTNGWRSFKKQSFPAKGWGVEDGWLHCLAKGGGDIISEAEFDNFELDWEWKQAPDGNSGLKYFIIETRPSAIGHEYQMIDDEREPDAKLADGKRVTAAFYDVLAPSSKTSVKPAGEINRSRIIVKGNHVEHWLNSLVQESKDTRVGSQSGAR